VGLLWNCRIMIHFLFLARYFLANAFSFTETELDLFLFSIKKISWTFFSKSDGLLLNVNFDESL
jgi:hypothetical protein